MLYRQALPDQCYRNCLMYTDRLVAGQGNSFYSFHNLKDDLRGGLQFSVNWYVNPPELMDEKEAALNFVYASENEKVNYETVWISKHQAIHYQRHYPDSNMNFDYWYIYHENIMIVITFMISQKEPADVKDKWLKRVTNILDSIELNVNKFHTTPMG